MGDESNPCPICMDQLKFNPGVPNQCSILPCGHMMCYSCIMSCLDKFSKCPLCNAIYNESHVVAMKAAKPISELCVVDNFSSIEYESHISRLQTEIKELGTSISQLERNQAEALKQLTQPKMDDVDDRAFKAKPLRTISISAKFRESSFLYAERRFLIVQPVTRLRQTRHPRLLHQLHLKATPIRRPLTPAHPREPRTHNPTPLRQTKFIDPHFKIPRILPLQVQTDQRSPIPKCNLLPPNRPI